jgi:hypothetical protein
MDAADDVGATVSAQGAVCMKGLQIDRRRADLCFAVPENTGRAFQKLALPLRDLIGVNVELLRPLRQSFLPL